MIVAKFLDEERDLLIMLLCLTGVNLRVHLNDPGQPRLRLSSHDLAEREINEISLYSKDLELVNNRLNTLGYELSKYEGDRAIFVKSKTYVSEVELGDIVQLRTTWGKTPAGARCIVYDVFTQGQSLGICLLSEDGNDLGCFNEIEQGKYLIMLKRSGFRYKFKSSQELMSDYDYGIFDNAFIL